MLDFTGRGERIRTSDLTVPNDRRGKNVSICLFESCSHQGILSVLHPFPFFPIRYRLSAENSVHKLATKHWVNPRLKQFSISTLAVIRSYFSKPLLIQNLRRLVKPRRALLESNLPRNTNRRLIETDSLTHHSPECMTPGKLLTRSGHATNLLLALRDGYTTLKPGATLVRNGGMEFSGN